MSAREKKLLIYFALAGFLILNFLGFNYFVTLRNQTTVDKAAAEQKLAIAEMFLASREQVVDEMEWLSQHEPEPAANQDVQTKLQQLVEKEAKTVGLAIKSQKPLPTDSTAGNHYHRAKLQIVVSGKEEALYRWFDRLNIPEDLRIATHINLSPNKQDDTLIDCTATIEQWFVPPA